VVFNDIFLDRDDIPKSKHKNTNNLNRCRTRSKVEKVRKVPQSIKYLSSDPQHPCKRQEGREAGRQEGRKAGRKEGRKERKKKKKPDVSVYVCDPGVRTSKPLELIGQIVWPIGTSQVR